MNPTAEQHASAGGRPGRVTHPDPYLLPAIGVAALVTLTLPTIIAVIALARVAPPAPASSVETASIGVGPRGVSSGESTFKATCAVCHGADAEGVRLLGKPLRNSAFVQSQSDDELLDLLVHGRGVDDPLNTSGVLMPPRGAQNLGDERLASVVRYLRSIQDENAPTTSTEAWDLKGRDGGGAVAAVALSAHPGHDLFVASCSACHGEGAQGIENQGLPLTTSGFVRGKSDKDLITFIKTGRPVWDAGNTTGVDMPPKGGNPAITDDQLQTIVNYIRAVQKEAMGS